MVSLDLVIEIAGWIGAVLILSGYALLTAGKLKSESVAYQALNVVGALGFIVNGWWHGALPSTVLNVIWAGIGLVALWNIRNKLASST